MPNRKTSVVNESGSGPPNWTLLGLVAIVAIVAVVALMHPKFFSVGTGEKGPGVVIK